MVAGGTGPSVDADGLRDAAGAFAAAPRARAARLAVVVPAIDGIAAVRAGQVVTEGVLLARYRYDVLQTKAEAVGARGPHAGRAHDELAAGIERGKVLAARCAASRAISPTARPPTSRRWPWPLSPSASAVRPASAWRCSTSRRSGSWAAAVCSASTPAATTSPA